MLKPPVFLIKNPLSTEVERGRLLNPLLSNCPALDFLQFLQISLPSIPREV